AVRVDPQLWSGRPGCARQALQAQHFLASPRPQRNTIGARGGLQSLQRAIGVRFGEVGLVRFFDESPQRVNNCIVRLMILSSTASNCARSRPMKSFVDGLARNLRVIVPANAYRNRMRIKDD